MYVHAYASLILTYTYVYLHMPMYLVCITNVSHRTPYMKLESLKCHSLVKLSSKTVKYTNNRIQIFYCYPPSSLKVLYTRFFFCLWIDCRAVSG